MCEQKYINSQSNKKLDLEKITLLKDNALLKVYPKLWESWNFKRNDELGFDVWNITYASNKNVWWYCHVCNSDYDMLITNKTKGKSCSYCAGRKVNHTNSLATINPELALQWHPMKNGQLTPNNVTCGSNKKAWWICEKEHEWEAVIASRNEGRGCPYCANKKVLKGFNDMCTTNPKLASEWHSLKNGDLTPDTVTVYSGKKAWWKGSECGHEWEAKVIERNNGTGCPYCRGQKVNLDNSLASLNPKVANQWHPTLNGDLTADDFRVSSNKKAWWLGECGHEWESTINDRNSGNKCPYCSNQKVLKGFNDMWTTNPTQASWLLDSEDGYKYVQSSDVRVDWKCPDCKNVIKGKKIIKVNQSGLSCPSCSDGLSYPTKFFYNLFRALNIDFVKELSSADFNWIKDKRYDFYIQNLNLIVEVHGIQHYEECSRGRSLEEERENDKIKRELALSNGITHYIELDCRYSEMEYIKNSILNSELVELLDFSNVDWKQIALQSEKSLIFITCELWNKGMSISRIIKEIKICPITIRKYLKKGNKLGICKYDKTESMSRGHRKDDIHI